MLRVMRRELTLLIKKRHLIFAVIMGAATVYALLIGNLYKNQIVENIPVAICDLDDSPLSRELIRTISETEQFIFTENLTSEIEAVEVLERGAASAVLVVPKDFSKNFYSQNATELTFLQDGANIVPVNYSSTPINLVVGNFAARYNMQAAIVNATPTLSPAPISMSLRMSGNSLQGYLEFYIYGIMLMAAQVGICFGFGISIQADKKNPACSTVKFILAKEILYLALSLFSVIVAITLLAYFFKLPFRAEIWQLLTISAAFLFAMENLAGILGTFIKTETALIQCLIFYSLPGLLTAGYIWPELGMPFAVKILSAIQPAHYALADLRRISLTGVDLTYWQHVAILFFAGILAMAILIAISKRYKR